MAHPTHNSYTKEQLLELAKEAKTRQRESLVSFPKMITVEVPVLSSDDLPSLPYIKDVFSFIENVLYVSANNEEDCRKILKIYKQSEKFLLTRLLEFERDRPSSPEQDKRLHLYREKLDKKNSINEKKVTNAKPA